MSQLISQEHLHNAHTYESFRNEVSGLYEQGKPTSGEDSDMPLLEFTKLNINRMDRNEKSNKVKDEVAEKIQNLPFQVYWLVLAEGWCGDVAENLPIIKKMADTSDNVDLKVLYRDQNLDIMDQYLTNGGRSIPKLIAMKGGSLRELSTWGPRPQPLQEYVEEMKNNKDPNQPKKDFVNEIHEAMHKWYAKDRGQTLQDEFSPMVEEWHSVKAG